MFTAVPLYNCSDNIKITDSITVNFKVLMQILDVFSKECFLELRLKSIDTSCILLKNNLHGTLWYQNPIVK